MTLKRTEIKRISDERLEQFGGRMPYNSLEKPDGPKAKRPRNNIRQLKSGEATPIGEPRRYPDGRGYVRLRWKVGTYEYVEVYEHRLVAGIPDADVHHRDEDKGNNDPSNLEIVSRREHARQHGLDAAAASRRVNEWDGMRSQAAFDKRRQRLAREEARREFLRQIAELYTGGLSTTEVGAIVGRDASSISRALRAAGVVPASVGRRPSGEVSAQVRQVVQARAQMCCERCGRNLTWCGGQVHHRQPRQMGGSRVPAKHLPSNLAYLCADCHEWVEQNRAAALAGGWLVAQSEKPEDVPVDLARGQSLLTNDGGFVVIQAVREENDEHPF